MSYVSTLKLFRVTKAYFLHILDNSHIYLYWDNFHHQKLAISNYEYRKKVLSNSKT
ncbi:hypothetical protein H1P_390018 [Hyella patelloides LEGE 07179]|uniref:Transposase n=1 Tax=Hyella patelloides LEGE 07179 TaxID=945734 RepID=A0A563VWZ6_9CYAN|nr:hypothetical protein H1P_390018 [Hyella patelloides LEGE 07179]